MLRNILFAVALLSLALAGGCAKGGNGAGNGITVTVSDGNITEVGVNLSVTFTAAVTGTTNTDVAWTLGGQGCTGNPNPCGIIDGTTGVYQAPASAPKSLNVTITATSRADSTARGNLGITVVPITTVITPTPGFVGHGLVQQFTATAVPDNAPQTFAWTCVVSGVPCTNFVSNTSGVAVYTAAENACGNNCAVVSAVSTTDPGGCTDDPKGCVAAKFSVVTTRLPTGSYAFRFAGYDASNNPVAVAGTVAVTNGVVTGGVEDEFTASGPAQHLITGGSYSPSSLADNNTNNAGTLTLTTGSFPNQYQVVLDAAGDIQMIEADGHGKGSGVMERSVAGQFNTGGQPFVFVLGFTGVDASGHRVGYVGALPMTPTSTTTGTISGGQLDANDNGNSTNVCGSSPCAVGGSYNADPSIAGLWHMTLTSGVTMQFDFFVANGQTSAANPLTLYAISIDTIATRPAVSGTLAFQDPGTTYNLTALNGSAVSNLTGVDSSGSNSLVSLVLAAGNSSGNISGSFDANNAGTIVAAQSFSCTYTAATGGRYIVTLLGNGSTCTAPALPFVFYASGANRGFLLDQSSAAVMTGSMDPQQGNAFAPAELPSTYALTTVSGATSGVSPIAANLLLTSPGNQVFNVAGTQYPGPQTVTGTYTLSFSGTGTITLTAPAASYVIYPVDAKHVEMIDVDHTVTNAAVVVAEE